VPGASLCADPSCAHTACLRSCSSSRVERSHAGAHDHATVAEAACSHVAPSLRILDVALMLGAPGDRPLLYALVTAAQSVAAGLPPAESQPCPLGPHLAPPAAPAPIQIPAVEAALVGVAARQGGWPGPCGDACSPCTAVPLEPQPPSLADFASRYMRPRRPVLIRGLLDDWPALGGGAGSDGSRRWADLNYLTAVAGSRTVPVELGAHYMADGWGTTLMTLGDFIRHYVGTAEGDGRRATPAAAYLAQHTLFDQVPQLAADVVVPPYCALGDEAVASSSMHGLGGTDAETRRIDSSEPPPKRRRLVLPPPSSAGDSNLAGAERLPAACCEADTGAATAAAVPCDRQSSLAAGSVSLAPAPRAGEGSGANAVADRLPSAAGPGGGGGVAINAWFGPGGTVSCLHHDPSHNVLAQVVGCKRVRLYDASAATAEALYPHPGVMANTARVDPAVVACDPAAAAVAFPSYIGTPHHDVVLAPGDALYIPPRWWHHVTALRGGPSFSVSFWWDGAGPAGCETQTAGTRSLRVPYNPPKKDQKKGVPYPPSPAIKEIADSVRTWCAA
jgi:hypothetical protein